MGVEDRNDGRSQYILLCSVSQHNINIMFTSCSPLCYVVRNNFVVKNGLESVNQIVNIILILCLYFIYRDECILESQISRF